MKSLTGKFLLASRTLLDPNFARSAVLIVRHDADGAFGLIVNKPLPISVKAALGSAIDAAATVDAAVYSGGPCDGPVFVLHGDDTVGGESPVSGVFCTTDRDAIEALLVAATHPLKVFGSYSGWSPDQLEGELEEGSWLVSDATAAQVFSADPKLWQHLSSLANVSKYVRPDRIPDDPSVN